MAQHVMASQVHLEYHDQIAVITNDNPEKHNAFDDEMDLALFAIFAELKRQLAGSSRRPRTGVPRLLSVGQRYGESGRFVQPLPSRLRYQPLAAVVPPSTGMMWPVTMRAISLARNTTTSP